MLAAKFKLDTIDLKDAFLSKLIAEREVRKRRRLLERGFKPLPPPEEAPEEGEEVEEPVDPEIEEDPEEWDKEQHEKDLIRKIQEAEKGLIADGTWNRGWPEKLEKDGKVLVKEFAPPASREGGDAFIQFLIDSRRVPEIIVILKCSEDNALKRMIDEDAIKKIFDDQMEARAKKAEEKRAKDRQEKVEELAQALKDKEAEDPAPPEEEVEALSKENEEALVTWDKEREEQDKDEDENDPDRPDLQVMLDEARQKIKDQIEQDNEFLETVIATCEEKNIKVVKDLNTDVSAQYAFVKLLDKLKDRIQMRPDLIERELARALKPKELKFFEQSYTYKHSKFGRNSPLSLSNPVGTREYSVLYRERIYYLSDEDEKKQFLMEPAKYTKGVESVPLDVATKPRVCVLGMSKSGKSTLAEWLSAQTGAVHIQLGDVIQEYVERDCVQGQKMR